VRLHHGVLGGGLLVGRELGLQEASRQALVADLEGLHGLLLQIRGLFLGHVAALLRQAELRLGVDDRLAGLLSALFHVLDRLIEDLRRVFRALHERSEVRLQDLRDSAEDAHRPLHDDTNDRRVRDP
jgi:hypothetical protein